MEIGILTYHRSHNYGALLQSIATRLVLQEMGNNVYYVDYWPGYHQRMYAFFNWKVLRKNVIAAVRYIIHFLFTKSLISQRRANMFHFIETYIEPYCKRTSYDYKYDAIIYGSDQIWRKQPEGVGYNPVYFGVNDLTAKKHISYAASMGELPSTSKDKMKVKELVSHLDSISVRENDLAELLRTMGYDDVSICLDPTLLLKKSQWNEIFKETKYSGKKYILFYDLMPDSFCVDNIKAFAKSRGMELRVLHVSAKRKETYNDIYTVAPDMFVDLIRNAEFVFTSSFHGLVFSIIYNKPFYASFARNSGRAKSLLDNLGLSDYLLPPMSDLPFSFANINYSKVGNKLSLYREKSLSYIRKSLYKE